MVTKEQMERVRARMIELDHVFVEFHPNGEVSTTRCPRCGALAIAAVRDVIPPQMTEFGTALESPCDRSMIDKRLVFAPWNDEDTKARAERIAREDEQRRLEKKERRR